MYTGTFFALAYPGYRHNFGGGKPHSPTVPLVRHSGALARTEHEALCHRLVRQGGRKGARTAEGGGSVGEFVVGLPGLWVIVGDSNIV